jgi:hypothetical protein
MFPKKPRRISTDLDVISFSSASPIDLSWIACGRCRLGLQRHQPDPKSPGRLLGTCDSCGLWYLILIEPDMVSALMVAIPEGESFSSAWEEHGGPDGEGTGLPSDKSEADSGSAPSSPLPGEEPMGEGMVEVHAP